MIKTTTIHYIIIHSQIFKCEALPFMNIEWANIHITQMIGNTGVFIGNNQAGQWYTNTKTNMGFGYLAGKGNVFLKNRHTIYDNDGIDFSAPSSESS